MSDEVQVTPELLARLEARSAAASQSYATYEGTSTQYQQVQMAFMLAATPAVVLALVKRIRELESKVGRHGTQVPELRESTFRT